MHEIGIVKSMCQTVLAYAEENHIPVISEIVVEIGEGSGIIPMYVEELYPVVANDTPLKDTKLIIEIIPGMAECEECDEIFNVLENEGHCPNCGSTNKLILSGLDFNIREIHIPDN